MNNCTCENKECNVSCKGQGKEKNKYTWKEYVSFIVSFGIILGGIYYLNEKDKEYKQSQEKNVEQIQVVK